jgi:hypothetical protein
MPRSGLALRSGFLLGLHAIDARTVFEWQFDSGGPAVAGPPALCSGQFSGDLSPAIVDYMRKEQPGTILVDINERYLYRSAGRLGDPRYGVTGGEEALLAWSGVATGGRTAEWPDWIPPPAEPRAYRPVVGSPKLRNTMFHRVALVRHFAEKIATPQFTSLHDHN